MDKINLDRTRVLELIEINRNKHAEELKTATEGYNLEVVEKLTLALAEATAGTRYTTNLAMLPPANYLKEYDRVIQMLKLSSDATITLTQQEFAQYVMDEWIWRESARFTNSVYSSKLVG